MALEVDRRDLPNRVGRGHVCAVHLTKVTVEQATVRLQLTATAPTAACPGWGVPSSSGQRRDQRHLTDLP
jgi:hypothetical protein